MVYRGYTYTCQIPLNTQVQIQEIFIAPEAPLEGLVQLLQRTGKLTVAGVAGRRTNNIQKTVQGVGL